MNNSLGARPRSTHIDRTPHAHASIDYESIWRERTIVSARNARLTRLYFFWAQPTLAVEQICRVGMGKGRLEPLLAQTDPIFRAGATTSVVEYDCARKSRVCCSGVFVLCWCFVSLQLCFERCFPYELSIHRVFGILAPPMLTSVVRAPFSSGGAAIYFEVVRWMTRWRPRMPSVGRRSSR